VRTAAKLARIIAAGLAILIAGLVATLGIRVEEWRTGDQRLSPLNYAPGQGEHGPRRLWIDTDAACGYSDRTDPDDCFAIALLARESNVDLVGISSLFGPVWSWARIQRSELRVGHSRCRENRRHEPSDHLHPIRCGSRVRDYS
jgi:hypothetical protein